MAHKVREEEQVTFISRVLDEVTIFTCITPFTFLGHDYLLFYDGAIHYLLISQA